MHRFRLVSVRASQVRGPAAETGRGDCVDAIAAVEEEVRELVRRRRLDPVTDGPAIRTLVSEVVDDYEHRSLTSTLPALADPAVVSRHVFDAVAGFGPLQPYLDDPLIEEIWINDPGRVFV